MPRTTKWKRESRVGNKIRSSSRAFLNHLKICRISCSARSIASLDVNRLSSHDPGSLFPYFSIFLFLFLLYLSRDNRRGFGIVISYRREVKLVQDFGIADNFTEDSAYVSVLGVCPSSLRFEIIFRISRRLGSLVTNGSN